MTREEKLQDLIKEKYKSIREFSRQAGIPNSTLNSMFKKGIGGTAIDTVMIVCHALGITPDDLIDELTVEKEKSYYFSWQELSRIQKYRDLLPEYQKAADDNIKSLFELQTSMMKELLKSDNVIDFPSQFPLYDMPASAGTGQFLDSDNYEIITVSNAPAHTTFLLRALGDSMEPKIHDGDLLYIKQQPNIEDGEIGVFFLDGNVYVKKQESKDGVYRLISLNPAYEPIEIVSGDCKCYGKVLNK